MTVRLQTDLTLNFLLPDAPVYFHCSYAVASLFSLLLASSVWYASIFSVGALVRSEWRTLSAVACDLGCGSANVFSLHSSVSLISCNVVSVAFWSKSLWSWISLVRLSVCSTHSIHFECRSVYSLLCTVSDQLLPSAGRCGCLHSLSEMATIGCAPPWVSSYCNVPVE